MRRSPSRHVLGQRSFSYRVHLSQHGPLGEEERLLGVHDDQVEERAPGVVLQKNQRINADCLLATGRRAKDLTLLFSSR